MLRKILSATLICLSGAFAHAQNVMTPELLWSLGRVAPEMVTPDGSNVIYGVTYFNKDANTSERNLYSIPIDGGQPVQTTTTQGSESNVLALPDKEMGYIYKGQLWASDWTGKNAYQVTNIQGDISNARMSPDGKMLLFTQDVKINPSVTDLFPDLTKANAEITESLDYRHWDTWEDGSFSHVFYAAYSGGKIDGMTDIMKGEAFDCPQQPFGGIEDVQWAPDSRHIVYVCKKLTGTAYTISTNTDIYAYSLDNGQTTDVTMDNKGYDTNPVMSPDGTKMIWLSMEHDGYESDKNRIMVEDINTGEKRDLSNNFDESAESIMWSNDGKRIFFTCAVQGTIQMYVIDFFWEKQNVRITQVTKGPFDVEQMVGEAGKYMVIARTDMNHAAELYKVDENSGDMTQITHVNDVAYAKISMGKIETKEIETSGDEVNLLVYIIYPPNFDPTKKYPTLLYCQGGPQSAISQFYSYRWNFQLMAANGYIVVAPCRRGMPGFGTAWNEEISKDWGGMAIKDYLDAIDYAKSLPFVDPARCAAVGASYGGYSVYMLEGVNGGRFKTFIAHDGLFNLQSFYGTTDEMWFANWDLGGPYWEHGAQDKSYQQYNPINFVNKWTAPILIFQGGRDYRTTEDQAFQAFQAAQLRGIKSKLVYLPDESHWVSSCQDGILWQREFFGWLRETL